MLRREAGARDAQVPDDELAASELIEALGRRDVGHVAVVLQPLRELLHASCALMFGVRRDGNVACCDYAHGAGLSLSTAQVERALACAGRVEDLQPDAQQDGRVEAFWTSDAPHFTDAVVHEGGKSSSTIRVLLVEGPRRMTWIGALRDEPFTERERTIVERLVGPLRERLLADRHLANAQVASGVLELALVHVDGAAFVVGGDGEVLYTNSTARARLAVEGPVLERRLAAARLQPDPQLEVRAGGVGGRPHGHLIIAKSDVATPDVRSEAAAAAWRLTPRQRDVLARIVRGLSNARISVELGISERTVEVHVTAILERAQRTSRAELISAVLMTS